VRWATMMSGRAPRTVLFPHDWFDSPNIHFLTVLDFESLAEREHWNVERRIFVSGHRQVSMFPNLTAQIAVFLVSAQPK
jgi:methionine biosynthesis protein MetW